MNNYEENNLIDEALDYVLDEVGWKEHIFKINFDCLTRNSFEEVKGIYFPLVFPRAMINNLPVRFGISAGLKEDENNHVHYSLESGSLIKGGLMDVYAVSLHGFDFSTGITRSYKVSSSNNGIGSMISFAKLYLNEIKSYFSSLSLNNSTEIFFKNKQLNKVKDIMNLFDILNGFEKVKPENLDLDFYYEKVRDKLVQELNIMNTDKSLKEMFKDYDEVASYLNHNIKRINELLLSKNPDLIMDKKKKIEELFSQARYSDVLNIILKDSEIDARELLPEGDNDCFKKGLFKVYDQLNKIKNNEWEIIFNQVNNFFGELVNIYSSFNLRGTSNLRKLYNDFSKLHEEIETRNLFRCALADIARDCEAE